MHIKQGYGIYHLNVSIFILSIKYHPRHGVLQLSHTVSGWLSR